MAIKIGHARADENGNSRGGAAGDQTGREVCVAKWYLRDWAYVLRAKSSYVAERMASACEDGCANKNIGYDQNQRNTLHTQARNAGYNLAKISVPCETDCSAFMTVCAIAAGVTGLEYTGNAPTTRTMLDAFDATGSFYVLTDSKYRKSDAYLKRGDIVVNPGHHTFMVLENGSKAESGEYNMDTIKKGSKGKAVKVWQIIVGAEPDGDFGAKTVTATKTFQKAHGLTVDGIVGEKSWKAGLESL